MNILDIVEALDKAGPREFNAEILGSVVWIITLVSRHLVTRDNNNCDI